MSSDNCFNNVSAFFISQLLHLNFTIAVKSQKELLKSLSMRL